MRTMSGDPCLHYDCTNRNSFGYCKTTACINPKYSNIGTAQYGQGVQKRIVTNADRIRTMSDEELAEWFYSGDFPWCVYEEDVVPCTYEDIPVHPCDRCLLNWLKQEADDDKSGQDQRDDG